jgi:fructosamine-3-kinase
MLSKILAQSIADDISNTLKQRFEIKTSQVLHGGDINQAYKITDHDRTYFVKINQSDRRTMFEAELDGLNQIANTHTIRVPTPICTGIAESYSYLVLEYLSLVALTEKTRYELGIKLAELHLISGSTAFGLGMSNTIGTTSQPNPWTTNWIEFWQDTRIKYQISLAIEKGAKFSYANQLLDVIPTILKGHSPKPSLVHGDLWGGNVGALDTGEVVIFDPAVYWGDREVDLAMTELFGGFGSTFYQGYESIYPITPGFAKRKILYNLYHILNHYNLFGGSYAGQADRMMASLVN